MDLSLQESISAMRKLHFDVESQFLSFNRIVPYDHNPPEVYSPRLYSVLQNTCAQVISMMHTLSVLLGLSENKKQQDFPFYYERLNSQGMLSLQTVSPKELPESKMTPFLINNTEANSPSWWKKYNDTKHNLPEGAYNGNLENVMYALGSLVILHNIAIQISKIPKPIQILDSHKWIIYSDDITNDLERLKLKAKSDYESRIFFYVCHFFN